MISFSYTIEPLLSLPSPLRPPPTTIKPQKKRKNREALKLLLLSPRIIPRCLGALASCTILACMSALAAWNWPEDKPLSKPRRQLTVAASKLAGAVLWSLGFSIRVRGEEHLQRALRAAGERPILIFNHVREECFFSGFFFFFFRSSFRPPDLEEEKKN